MNGLIPQSYHRAAFNTLHGNELASHTERLTQEQAELINAHYDIDVVVGTHGMVPDNLSDPRKFITAPTQKEYEEVASIVEDMSVEDVLFTENIGFTTPQAPSQFPEILQGTKLDSAAETGRRQLTEEGRKDYIFNAVEYAQALAALKGIKVFNADIDAFEEGNLSRLSDDRAPLELMSTNPEDEALIQRIQSRRERAAAAVVKDWALEHLPPAAANTFLQEGRKRKLVLLFGQHHKEGLELAFKDMGLNIHTNTLESSTWDERRTEQLPRLATYVSSMMRGNH